MRRQRFPIGLSTSEKTALRRLAQEEGLSQAAALRRLLHLEARQRGLLASANDPPAREPGKTQQEVTS